MAAGVRRIEAVTGEGALAEVRRTQQALAEVAGLVRASRDEAVHKVGQVLARNKALEKELSALKAKLAQGGGSDLTEQAREVGDVRVLSARLDGIDAKSLRDAIDRLRDKLGDDPGEDAVTVPLQELMDAANKAGVAFEILILKKKIQG